MVIDKNDYSIANQSLYNMLQRLVVSLKLSKPNSREWKGYDCMILRLFFSHVVLHWKRKAPTLYLKHLRVIPWNLRRTYWKFEKAGVLMTLTKVAEKTVLDLSLHEIKQVLGLKRDEFIRIVWKNSMTQIYLKPWSPIRPHSLLCIKRKSIAFYQHVFSLDLRNEYSLILTFTY